MVNKLPETAFIYIYDDGDSSWLNINESLEDCANRHTVTVVGVYKLVETKKVILRVTEEVVEQ